ncbi:coatomer protein complex, beta prime [Coccomyxa subellipsoidea C-169]|uniref:Coatomer subunit beta' n=1 Tax=Coccomyxa subellipsoidea (strain C-169) TaxID=574566 RepID=I0YR24_COCSC|nr:coatomer protein complex, beta prime [Coccomyxa subellipsoidea C-169]EIE20843.1 coatomer protein complex, beta prime [Coccomyxa subellipsoidea C-169]|eukprot:XP_005645387.1 coatomer protein complex, beta prime [Coccomyxa subellipsoidea C-169]
MKKFTQRSDRVKGVDLHPTEPWLLANLYSGNVYIWSTADQSLIKSFEVTELPVRAAKFVARKQWIVCGSDDMYIRVYNYNTMDKVKAFEAHTDYIRSIAVHPSLPYILSSSDDMLIKLWDWDKGWTCNQIFEGHSHYVMQVVFNPKDTNTFASASLDRTVKVWSIGQPTPNFTLDGHEKGVNCVDYFTGGDRPYLMSGADDKLAKVWDYQTKACVQTLEGHAHNVSADGMVKIWHSTTYRLENTINYGLERLWALGACKGSNHVALGFDEGTVLIKIGREEPVASMDSSGKIIWARHNEIQTVNVKSLGADFEDADGERLPLAVKDLGSCDMYPSTLVHSPNGRFVAVCGDGEYIMYTALAWRNKSYGSALSFVWGDDSSVFATRESGSSVRIFRNFKEVAQVKPGFNVEEIHGGTLLAVRSADFVCFYDWATAKCCAECLRGAAPVQVIRRIDVPAKDIRWSDSGELVAIIAEASFYVLRFNRDAVEEAAASGAEFDEDGIDEAFELQTETSETVRTGLWVGDCFIYTNGAWRLNYCVGGEVTTMFHLDRPMYLLGYLASQSKVYLIDKEFSVMSYTLLLSLIEYKTLVLRKDYAAANEILPQIPQEQRNAVARFLEGREMKREALKIATDPDYRFDLAVTLGELGTALQLAEQSGSELKWRQLGELALSSGKLQVAEECLKKAGDLSGLLLLHTAKGSATGLADLVQAAGAQNRQNVVFLCQLLLGNLSACVDLLLATGRIPEAAFFARTYLPSRMTEVVKVWRDDLSKINAKAAESLADPAQYPNLFPNYELALHAEQYQAQKQAVSKPASAFKLQEAEGIEDLLSLMQSMSVDAATPHANGDLASHAAPGAPPYRFNLPSYMAFCSAKPNFQSTWRPACCCC